MTTQTFDRKGIFKAVRQMLGRCFKQSEVDKLDDAIEAMLEGKVVPDAPGVSESLHVPSRLSEAGEKLIKRFEGCARVRKDGLIEAYPDPGTGGEPWTIGWGSTGRDHFDGGNIGPGTVWTKEQCDERATNDYRRYADDVVKALGGAISATSQAQFDAMVSFHYNTGAINRATLTRKHIAGDFAGAEREFHRWNKAGGRVMKGLARRRAAEAKMYRAGS